MVKMSDSKASKVFPLRYFSKKKIFSSRNRAGCFEGMVQSYTPDVGLVLTMIFQVNIKRGFCFRRDFMRGEGNF